MIQKMPDAFKGRSIKNGGYTTSNPREWTSDEIKWVQDMIQKGFTASQIAESIDRTATSVSIKIKRLGKKDGTYNAEHIDDKYDANDEFLKFIQPNSILDLYSGEESYYKGYNITSNDINDSTDADYHMDALECICRLYPTKYDLVDLDPYGSAYDCFDLAIKMARKGIIITFGELGHKRWKRLDFVSRYYGIKSLEDFTIENLIDHVLMIGRRNKKNLIPYIIKEWNKIGRVYFVIESLKITEQWDKEK